MYKLYSVFVFHLFKLILSKLRLKKEKWGKKRKPMNEYLINII
jgi:hypothetical protein